MTLYIKHILSKITLDKSTQAISTIAVVTTCFIVGFGYFEARKQWIIPNIPVDFQVEITHKPSYIKLTWAYPSDAESISHYEIRISELQDEELKALTMYMYGDAYLNDQQPHVIVPVCEWEELCIFKVRAIGINGIAGRSTSPAVCWIKADGEKFQAEMCGVFNNVEVFPIGPTRDQILRKSTKAE